MVSNGRGGLSSWGGELTGEANLRVAPLVGLLIVMILAPMASADSSNSNLQLRVDFSETENGLYYSDTTDLEVTIRIKNNGNQAQEFTYNPACPFNLVISSDTWRMDLDDERACPDQRRGMTIQPGQERILSTWSWGWSNVSSGELEFLFSQSDANIEVVESLVLQRSVEMPPDLKLKAVLAEALYDQFGYEIPMPTMIYLSLVNIGLDSILLPFDSNCRVQTDVLTDLSCGSGYIEPGDQLALGWLSLGSEELDVEHILYSISLSGVTGSSMNFEMNPSYREVPIMDNLYPSLTINTSEHLQWEFVLENTASEDTKLIFGNECLTQTHVISPSGEIIYDTRSTRLCATNETTHYIAPQNTYTVASEQWNFVGSNGCEIGDGMYLLVVSQPEYHIVTTQSFMHKNNRENPACGLEQQEPVSIQLRIDNLTVLDSGGLDERISFDLTIANMGTEIFNLYWPTDCALQLNLSLIGGASYRVWDEACSANLGQTFYIEPLETLSWPNLVVPFVNDGQELAHGNWQISIETTSTPALRTQLAHIYDGVYLQDIMADEHEQDEAQEVEQANKEAPQPVILAGDWNYVTTNTQGCWLLTDQDGVERSFVAHMQDGGWYPTPGLIGNYVVEESVPVGPCSAWSGIVILQTLEETGTVSQINSPIKTTSPVPTPEDKIVDAVPVSISIVATTTFSLMGLLYLGNTEWIRIPAIQFGIGLVGMVRKNNQRDGEYQRGRIMGYLTANPGVHFRALLAALSMSNGQLSHHLKYLENGDQIWRRKDGRLVRFYPTTIQSTLNDDELPIPLLTPDPNSLQGKILRLLDATENDIVNLSQKELSVRLEASQQLISHHLSTLQKFGLVEREKIGMRYRYQLTREAIFLVNSSEYDISTE